MDTNILLESGTNELEVLEFTLGDNHYGINVAKIREILQYMPVTPVPNTHPSVEGIFMPRDTMITVINLKNCLNLPHTDEKDIFSFSLTRIGLPPAPLSHSSTMTTPSSLAPSPSPRCL